LSVQSGDGAASARGAADVNNVRALLIDDIIDDIRGGAIS